MSTNAIEFLGKKYIPARPKLNVVVPEDVFVLEALKSSNLVELYNLVAENLGKKRVNKFADKPTGVKRTWAALEEYAATDVEQEKPSRMRFVFKPGSEGIQPIRNEDSLRGRLIALYKKGGTFEQAMEVVKKFDADRGKEPFNVRIRTYEATRIIHYYLGWGMRQDENGVITIYADE